MKIAIHAADLDHARIDGTRVYMKHLLSRFAQLSPDDEFLIYHRANFNPALAPPESKNYFFKKITFPLLWTQLRFAWEVFKDKPDVLWLPMHNLPMLRRKRMRTVVTIHDLAFKLFPAYFPKKDLRKLNLLADYAIKHADKLIAVSQSTKNDILKFYPSISEEKISVVHHGFDAELFQQQTDSRHTEEVLRSYGLMPKAYLLYVGAIQPRKNLIILIEAFEKIKEKYPEMKLVIAGARAWSWEDTIARIAASPYAGDIIETGRLPFEQQPALYQNASVFVFPELHAGFGIPILEAFASGVPVVLANNSSLPEVGGDGALYFEANDSEGLVERLGQILGDENLRVELIAKGKKRLENFSWEKCAKETLSIIKEDVLQ